MATLPDELLSAAGEGPAAPFRVLRRAAAWAAAAVSEAAGADDATALTALAELDLALADLGQLASAVPALIKTSFPGGQVEAELAARTARAEEAAAAVTAQQSALTALKSADAELTATLAAHQQLRDQVTRLRRLERLAGALTELAAQLKLLNDRIAALTESTAAPEENLAAGCAELIRLTTERLAILEPRTRELAEQAGAEQARLAELEAATNTQQAELAKAAERLAELRELRDSGAAALRLHAQADLEVLTALAPSARAAGAGPASGLDAARQSLAEIESSLAQVELRLTAALQARELTPVTGP
jgi:chromosome segregation ATPase